MLKINTKKSLYNPITIEVDGKTYSAPEVITLDWLVKVDAEQREAMADPTHLPKVLEMVFGIPLSISAEMDIRDQTAVNEFFIRGYTNPEKSLGDEKKSG